MGGNAFAWVFHISNNHARFIGFNWMEGYRNFFKFYCSYVDFKYGDEHTCKTVRFLQLRKEFPMLSKNEAVLESSRKMMLPILYTVLTTICAFLSLVFSGIKPIIDFGLMMTIGLIVSLFVTFLLLPSLLSNFSSENEIKIKRH